MNLKERLIWFCKEVERGILTGEDKYFEIENIETHEKRVLSMRHQRSAEIISRLLAIADTILSLTSTNSIMSSRDLYYLHKHIFSSQELCNSTVFLLGQIIQATRVEMKIISSAKGLVSGKIAFQFHACADESNLCQFDTNTIKEEGCGVHRIEWMWTHCAQRELHPKGSLIEAICNISVCIDESVKAIVVIEKEGVFSRLCADKFTKRFPCIIVTGCGVPDIATRSLVALICHHYPKLKVFGLSDFNIYGLKIMFSYKFPTVSSTFESAGLSVRKLRWIGLRSSHVQDLLQCHPHLTVHQQLLTDNDRSVSLSVIKKLAHDHDDHYGKRYIDEVESMLKIQYKMELECLYSADPLALCKFIERSILSEDAI